MSGTRKRRFFGPLMIAILLVASALMPNLAYDKAAAANGDFVHKTYFQGGCGFLGVGIAFDGRYLWYSCYASHPDLYKADPLTGTVLASYNVAGGLGSLAWDGKRKKIWAGWGAGAGAEGDVRLIDPDTGTGTVVFNATNARQCGLDDGIAYDAQDDTLY
ncbi:MAG TPA: hypothetical protein VK464_10925, partial [Symbiobacteriaceae bacterium]|nr:hypothetical protein [Symbiobacteriaceae bacterium]